MSGMKKASSGYCTDPNDQSNVYIPPGEMNRNLGKRVIRVEKWQCPLENAWAVVYCVGIGHQGVVVTLEDRKTQYLVHKLPSTTEKGKGDVVVAYASGMGKNWSPFDKKEVKNSKLIDYLDACGGNYDSVWDNCMHAVGSMWELK